MSIKIREKGDITILDLDGRIDINSSDIIETVGYLNGSGKVNLVLNLENVDLVDYSGLSILAIAYKNTANHKGKMEFLHVPLAVMELLKVVKLDSVFETYSTEEEAINGFLKVGAQGLLLRRRFKRLDMHLEVKYNTPKGGTTLYGKALNISAAGIYIQSPRTLPINSTLDLYVSLPRIPKELEAAGKVVWIADRELQPHHYPGMGVAFAHLTPEKEKVIIDFIDQNISRRAGS